MDEISGDQQVEKLKVHNKKTGEASELAVDGIFIAVGILPNSDEFEHPVEMDEGKYLIAGEEGITNIPGVFAAGDVRTKMLRQIVTAVSDGANAVTSVQKYLLCLLYTSFHAVSAGKTRSAAEALGSDQFPYLASVECPKDLESKQFLDCLLYTSLLV